MHTEIIGSEFYAQKNETYDHVSFNVSHTEMAELNEVATIQNEEGTACDNRMMFALGRLMHIGGLNQQIANGIVQEGNVKKNADGDRLCFLNGGKTAVVMMFALFPARTAMLAIMGSMDVTYGRGVLMRRATTMLGLVLAIVYHPGLRSQ